MTLKEVNEKIKSSPNKNWYKNLETSFKFDHLNIHIKKVGFGDIYQFVKRQDRGWSNVNFKIPKEMIESKSLFKNLREILEDFLNKTTGLETSTLDSLWQGSQNLLNNINKKETFITESPFTTFLLELYDKYSIDHYNGAFNYLLRPSHGVSFNNPNQITGALMAYEFRHQDSTTLPKRRGHEKSSNSRLRNSFEKLFTETQKETHQFYSDLEKKTEDYINSTEKLLEENQQGFNTWIKTSKKNEEEYNKYNLERVRDLESLYSSKLMLEKPADYWNLRARELNEEAKNWLKYLMGSITISVILLVVILSMISNGTLSELFSKTGSAIRWSIVFITLISFLAYSVKIFSRLSFSAYHLARDAEEKKQLVYVFLALKKENAIENEERVLVLQSIFSRAESGLLKDDSSPTMPGSSSVFEKLLGKN